MTAQAVPRSGVVTFLFTDVEGSTRRWDSRRQLAPLSQSGVDGLDVAHGARLGKRTDGT
jgi:class 3 adenylate cyclase